MKKKIKPINLGVKIEKGKNIIDSIAAGEVGNVPLAYVSCTDKVCVDCRPVWDGIFKKYIIICRSYIFEKEMYLNV